MLQARNWDLWSKSLDFILYYKLIVLCWENLLFCVSYSSVNWCIQHKVLKCHPSDRYWTRYEGAKLSDTSFLLSESSQSGGDRHICNVVWSLSCEKRAYVAGNNNYVDNIFMIFLIRREIPGEPTILKYLQVYKRKQKYMYILWLLGSFCLMTKLLLSLRT